MSKTGELQACEECVAPADAFELVGDETRLSILEALWRVDTPARFSDVREEVGTRDSAQFNYHLGKLVGTFVRKTEEGYELLTAGQRVVQAVLAGSFTEHPQEEIAIDDACTICDGELSARYADEMLSIECTECGHRHGEYPFPPGGLHHRTDEEVLEAFDQRVRHLSCLAKDGVCQQCGQTLRSTIGLGLLDHSEVASFYSDHGVSLSEVPYWQLRWCVDDAPVTVLEEDPRRFQVEMTLEAETLRVVVDEDLNVVETTRETAATV